MKKVAYAFLLLLVASSFSAAFAETSPKIGSAPPPIELTNLAGKLVKVDFTDQKQTIVFFFTTWSKSCQEEYLDLAAIEKRAAIFPVSLDKKRKDLDEFVKKNGQFGQILTDRKLKTIELFQVIIIPTTFCVNRQGVIEKIFVDYDANVKKSIEEWLAHS